jgi:hypothetical protein
MFSATKYVLDGAVVALVSGLLLAGVLPQRSDVPSEPGAVASPASSPAPSPSVDPGSY